MVMYLYISLLINSFFLFYLSITLNITYLRYNIPPSPIIIIDSIPPYRFFKSFIVCVKSGDNTTHHPHLILDWGYTPAYQREKAFPEV